MPPKVSIIVPVHNTEKYISRCIDSILAQTFTEFECILVNDCSSDNSPGICDEYANKDNRIKVIHKQTNQGASLARKTGLDISLGEYIQFVDSDDWIEPDMTKKLYDTAIKADSDIVACDYYKYDSNTYHYKKHTYNNENKYINLGFTSCFYLWNKLYKKSIFNHIVFPNGGNYEDRVIYQQAIFYANKISHIPYPLYHWFFNPDSITRTFNVKKYIEWQNNILLNINFLKNNANEDYKKLTENINDYVNRFKYSISKNEILRKNKYLLNFYPESNYKRWLIKYYLKKILKFTLPYGLIVYLLKKHK